MFTFYSYCRFFFGHFIARFTVFTPTTVPDRETLMRCHRQYLTKKTNKRPENVNPFPKHICDVGEICGRGTRQTRSEVIYQLPQILWRMEMIFLGLKSFGSSLTGGDSSNFVIDPRKSNFDRRKVKKRLMFHVR